MALPATDNFNRANESPIAGNWSTVTGEGSCALDTNQVHVSGVGTDGAIRWNADAFGNDHYSQIVVTVLNTDANKCVGPIVRAQAAADTFYAARCLGPAGASAVLKLHKTVAGVGAELTSATVTINVNDTVKLEIVGNTLTCYVNGVSRATTNDSAIPSGGGAGILCFVDSGNNTDAAVDTWQGDNSAADVLMPQICL
jgi:hypothetical protein